MSDEKKRNSDSKLVIRLFRTDDWYDEIIYYLIRGLCFGSLKLSLPQKTYKAKLSWVLIWLKNIGEKKEKFLENLVKEKFKCLAAGKVEKQKKFQQNFSNKSSRN